jgi:hypothetical protein
VTGEYEKWGALDKINNMLMVASNLFFGLGVSSDLRFMPYSLEQ